MSGNVSALPNVTAEDRVSHLVAPELHGMDPGRYPTRTERKPVVLEGRRGWRPVIVVGLAGKVSAPVGTARAGKNRLPPGLVMYLCREACGPNHGQRCLLPRCLRDRVEKGCRRDLGTNRVEVATGRDVDEADFRNPPLGPASARPCSIGGAETP